MIPIPSVNTIGKVLYARWKVFSLRRTAYFTVAKIAAATEPAKTGEIIQEIKILIATFHSTESKPLAAIEKPMIDPTISCVVETGNPYAVAINNITLAENNAENIPNMRSAGSALYKLMSIIFDRMVPVTDAPRKKAPENSQTEAITVIKINDKSR